MRRTEAFQIRGLGQSGRQRAFIDTGITLVRHLDRVRTPAARSRRRHNTELAGSVNKIDHLGCRMDCEGVVGEAGPRRNVGCHLASKAELPVGCFLRAT